MLVASEEATFGSVIAKHDLISPANRGVSHCRCECVCVCVCVYVCVCVLISS